MENPWKKLWSWWLRCYLIVKKLSCICQVGTPEWPEEKARMHRWLSHTASTTAFAALHITGRVLAKRAEESMAGSTSPGQLSLDHIFEAPIQRPLPQKTHWEINWLNFSDYPSFKVSHNNTFWLIFLHKPTDNIQEKLTNIGERDFLVRNAWL